MPQQFARERTVATDHGATLEVNAGGLPLNVNQISKIATLVGEPARTSMLCALLSGQALTATELAHSASITPQTASKHLAALVEAGLLSVYKQGRHRYHQLASPNVATVLESIIRLSVDQPLPVKPVVTGPRDAAMRKARTCYDHFAGRLGVAITDGMITMKMIRFEDEAGTITKAGQLHLDKYGIQVIDPASKRVSKRPICRPCMDWSERRPHIAGRVGAAICSHFLDNKLARRVTGSRTIIVTESGNKALREIFNVQSL